MPNLKVDATIKLFKFWLRKHAEKEIILSKLKQEHYIKSLTIPQKLLTTSEKCLDSQIKDVSKFYNISNTHFDDIKSRWLQN